jgi:hypothetical protein
MSTQVDNYVIEDPDFNPGKKPCVTSVINSSDSLIFSSSSCT